jgi:hypothetical protein
MHVDQLKADKEELKDAVRQMLGAFDSPIARMRMKGEFANESREFAREILERISKRDDEEAQQLKPFCECAECSSGWNTPADLPKYSAPESTKCSNCENEATEDGRCVNCFATDGSENPY